nr:DUF2797 domain-containing protein [Alteromonas sediminis]
MHTHYNDNGFVDYSLPIGEALVSMEPILGQKLTLTFEQAISCTHCGRKTKKSFNQGYCYPCVISLAQCDTCIIKPELCHFHEGTCREPEWGEANCLQDHFVYLANTGALKVGITRHVTDAVSSRWMDQGATQALAIMRVPNRKVSGLVEMAFKKYVADKTNWRTMLKGEPDAINLQAEKDRLLDNIKAPLAEIEDTHGLTAFSETNGKVHKITYPVSTYPEKIKSINLDKTPTFTGTLNGIKGQYWLLDEDRVINIRKYAGYHCTLTIE